MIVCENCRHKFDLFTSQVTRVGKKRVVICPKCSWHNKV